jgi:hypothetical protein
MLIELDAVLTKYEADFVRAVVRNPGGKHPWNSVMTEGARPLWERPEELGLVRAVGSFKWEPTDKLVVAIRSEQHPGES